VFCDLFGVMSEVAAGETALSVSERLDFDFLRVDDGKF